MKATELLKHQHREVKELFKRIERTKDGGERRGMFDTLAHSLVAHDAIERELFYPACKRELGAASLMGESLAEHGVIEFSIMVAEASQGSEDGDANMGVLSELVRHHIEEEEEELIPRMAKVMHGETLELLGAKMKARFDDLRDGDYRAALRDNLRRLLDGRPVPRNGAIARAKKRPTELVGLTARRP